MKTEDATKLPPGQRLRATMPRFGLPQFATRFPRELERIRLHVSGRVAQALELGEQLVRLPRVELVADFHCVTTWSCRGLVWSGWRFATFYRELVLPLAQPTGETPFVVFRAQDDFHVPLLLEDLLAPDVLLADRLNGERLDVAHGSPLRLVAPAHYGYKSVKHLDRIELREGAGDYRPTGPRFLTHLRARVALEERGTGVPGNWLRHLYRPGMRMNELLFARALAAWTARSSGRPNAAPGDPPSGTAL